MTQQLPDLDAQAPQDQVAGGSHYLLVDHQVRVSGGERVIFRHVAARALTERGVESLANIEARFDPSFQRLTLHAAQLRRGNRVIDRLTPAAVKVLQRETELDALIFDGSRTAHLFLEDVRVGDVVEYSYSLRGQNPVFGGRQFSRVETQWAVPVHRSLVRLLWPAGRPLEVQSRNGAPEPRIVESAGEREYLWEARSVAPRVVEKDAPAWHDPYAAVQWSEFTGWPDVARWALPLYRLPERAGPRVAAAVAEIAAAEPSAEGRLLAALRYVQSQVRYLGVEIGAGSHAPNPPELVLQRRFGDCKDKTLLAVALLRGLGLQAEPALVNTSQQRGIANWQASPAAFNHVIVHASVAGRGFWLDPTRPAQSGRLDQLVQAEYGRALRISADAASLEAMAGEAVLTQRREVTIDIDGSSGRDRPASLTVTTVAFGTSAEGLRNTLANQSRDLLQKNYTNFYASRFQGVSMSSPLQVEDDASANRLTMTERYAIDRLWRHSDERKRLEAEVLVPDLYELLRSPPTTLRHAPLYTGHPIDLVHVTRVRLPPGFKIKPEDHRVVDPAFEFARRTDMQGDTLVLRDQFRTLVAEIDPADVPRYAANLEKARAAVAYSLYQYEGPVPQPSRSPYWLAAVVGVLAVLGSAWLARRAYLWDPAPPLVEPSPFSGGPRGLGGWLILPLLALVAGLWRIGREFFTNLSAYEHSRWLQLTEPGSEWYAPVNAALLLYELVANIGCLIGLLLVIVLFLQRRSSLPRAYPWLVQALLVVTVLDLAIATQSPLAAKLGAGMVGQVVGQAIGVAIWTKYFRQSVRVRNTFVRRRAAAPPNPAPAAPETPAPA